MCERHVILELSEAVLNRDADQLRKAIAKVEQHNYTKRLADVSINLFMHTVNRNHLVYG